ncbi:MAG: LLM class flavin-dependent oxidoreductase [Acidimicrobiales bacterium]
MRRSIVFATSAFAPLAELARQAEAAGFDRIWTTEFPDRDALIRAMVVGAATTRIGLASGIAYSFTRHPLALAAAALDVHEATGGRFTLGLGTATRAMRARWYGDGETRPVAQLGEIVALLRAAWASEGGRFAHRGEFYRCTVDGLALAARSAALPPLAVFGSGLNAGMLRAAAGCCDGLALHPLAAGPVYLDKTVAPILAAAPGRGAALWVITSVDADEAQARLRAKRALAFFFSTPGYEGAAAGESWEDAPARIRARFPAVGADWTALADEVPEEMVDQLTLAGTPASVRAQLPALEARLAAAGVDELVFQTGVEDADEFTAICQGIIEHCRP